jgi:hypothetical protein
MHMKVVIRVPTILATENFLHLIASQSSNIHLVLHMHKDFFPFHLKVVNCIYFYIRFCESQDP